MKPGEEEFERHEQDLTGTGNPAPNSDLKRDDQADPHGNLSGERTADGTLSERASELSANEYVERLDQDHPADPKGGQDSMDQPEQDSGDQPKPGS
ncbi:MAG TPA: hypothetical protein VGE15_07460 [Sphingobacteriaceae bacterium]